MANLKIPATERSPEVDFDFESGRLSLKGESYPEDAANFFGPVVEALRGFLARPDDREIHFLIELIYFNSSSAKVLMNMLQTLESAAAKGRPVTVDWCYTEGDETMMEFGEDFSEDLQHVVFNLKVTRSA